MAEWVVLRTFNSHGEAEIVRGALLAEGVEAFVSSDDCGTVDPALTFARGVRLLVDVGDRERAEEILGDAAVEE